MTTNHTRELSYGPEVRRNGRAVFPLEAMIVHLCVSMPGLRDAREAG